ncbi:MAG: apbE [Firmicutes bacterium]|nr:apbE [Bacillota bacterium]
MKLIRILLSLVFLVLILFIIGCAPSSYFTNKPYKETQFLMDTIIEITAYGPNREAGVKAAFEEFKRIQKLSDHFNPESQVSKINQMAGVRPVEVDAELIEMVTLAHEISEKTEGAFDISIGPLTELWGIGHKSNFVPTQQEIDKVLPLVDYRKIQVDTAKNTIFLPLPGMKLDLGGVAKDYALNKSASVLREYGITSALINAGGDIEVVGNKPDDTPWRIGVQDPRDSEKVIAKFSLSPWNTSQTSGDYQRFFVKDNICYAHIIDPRTGRQPTELASVTLVYTSSDSYVSGDVASSGFMVLGLDKAMAALHAFPGVEAVFITTDGRVVISPNLNHSVELSH